MRRATILLGVLSCTLGVTLAPLWLIAVGVGLLILSTWVPDRPLIWFGKPMIPKKNPEASTFTVSAQLAILGALLIGVTIAATSTNFLLQWPIVTWLFGLCLLSASVLLADYMQGRQIIFIEKLQNFRQGGWKQPEIYLVIFLTAVAFWLRLVQLENLPPMHGDEGEMGMLAMVVLNPNEVLAPFATGFLDHPTLFHFLQAMSIRVFGQSVFGLRMISVIFGVMGVPFVYLAGRLGWGSFVGLIAASFLAFSHIHIHFSRMGLNNIHSVTMAILLLLAIFLCERDIRQGNADWRYAPWFMGGLVTGLAQYFYFGSRLLPFLLIFWLPLILWHYRSRVNLPLIGRLTLVPLGFFAAWSPLIPQFLSKPVTFNARQSGVSVFNPQNIPPELGLDPSLIEILLFQIQRNVRFFIDSGDVSSFYFGAAPGVTVFAAVLLWIGFGMAFARVKQLPNQMVLTWFVLAIGLGGVLTNTAPAATRLIMGYPAIALLCGFGAKTLISLLYRSHAQNRWFELSSGILIAALLAFSGTQIYFQQYAADPPQSFMIKIARELSLHTEGADTFLMGGDILYAHHGTIRYLNQPLEVRDLKTAEELRHVTRRKSDLFIVSVISKEDELDNIMRLYPDGQVKRVDNPNGIPLFVTYFVEEAEIRPQVD